MHFQVDFLKVARFACKIGNWNFLIDFQTLSKIWMIYRGEDLFSLKIDHLGCVRPLAEQTALVDISTGICEGRARASKARDTTKLPQAMKLRKVAELLFWLQVRNRSQTRWAQFLVETIWKRNWSWIWWTKLDLHARKFIDCISDISIWIRTRRDTWMKTIFIEFKG